MKEYWIEYELGENNRPNRIQIFRNAEDAKNFLNAVSDGKLVEVEMIQY